MRPRLGLCLRLWALAGWRTHLATFFGPEACGSGWRRRAGGESFNVFAHDAPADKPLQRAQSASVLGRHETDRVPHSVRPARPADAVNVILRVLGEVVVHHV